KDAAVDNADVLLPIAPFTETGGSFVNAEGRLQSFHGVVRSLGDSRPAWKVLRVLGNLLGLQGFSQESVEEVRAAAPVEPHERERAAGGCRAQWPAASGRRADLQHRQPRAPRHLAAADGRCE